jgi:putative transposase
MIWASIVGKIMGGVDEHLIERNAYLLEENRVLRRRVEGRVRFNNSERIALARAAKPLGRSVLAEVATLVTPDTLLRWHRTLVEKQPPPADASGPERPAIEPEIVQLVLRLARDNPSWGYDRIVGALKSLGHVISDTTVGNILKAHGEPPAPERAKNGVTWAQFIATHKDALVACDLFTKEIRTLGGLATYYVLFFIHVASRKVYVAGMTMNPNEQWMKQIARNLTMSGAGFLDGMKYLILDRDAKYAESFRGILEAAGVECLRLPPRSPNLNAFAERFVRSIKEECLDQLIFFGEPSLQRAVSQFVEHYHGERPHQSKGNVILFPARPLAQQGKASGVVGVYLGWVVPSVVVGAGRVTGGKFRCGDTLGIDRIPGIIREDTIPSIGIQAPRCPPTRVDLRDQAQMPTDASEHVT